MPRSFYIHPNRGEGRAGCFMALLVVGSLALLGFKFLPPIINNYQFEDAVSEIAAFGLVKNPRDWSDPPPVALQKEIIKKAQEMELPVEKKDIKVTWGVDKVEVDISYVVPITLPGYTYDYQFNIKIRK